MPTLAFNPGACADETRARHPLALSQPDELALRLLGCGSQACVTRR
jgi:hypothetical protein